MSDTKLCKDCKWIYGYREISVFQKQLEMYGHKYPYTWFCEKVREPVEGRMLLASQARAAGGECGPDGRLFEDDGGAKLESKSVPPMK